MPLNNVQIGVIAQYEVAKLLLIGSDGKLEVSWPMTDDERRDAEVHIRGTFGQSGALQVKAASHLQQPAGRSTPELQIPFTVHADALITDPRFWYHFSLINLTTGRSVDPQFLVDSTKVHAHATPRLRNGVWRYDFQANMAANSKDMWVPNRVYGAEAGRVFLRALEDLERLPRAEWPTAEFRFPPRAALIRRVR